MERIYIMDRKFVGIGLLLIGFAIIIFASILLPRYENITAVAVWIGAFGGSLVTRGNFYRRFGKI